MRNHCDCATYEVDPCFTRETSTNNFYVLVGAYLLQVTYGESRSNRTVRLPFELCAREQGNPERRIHVRQKIYRGAFFSKTQSPLKKSRE